jgi:hypothetical protein
VEAVSLGFDEAFREARAVLAGQTRSHVRASFDLAEAFLAMNGVTLSLRATLRRMDPVWDDDSIEDRIEGEVARRVAAKLAASGGS